MPNDNTFDLSFFVGVEEGGRWGAGVVEAWSLSSSQFITVYGFQTGTAPDVTEKPRNPRAVAGRRRRLFGRCSSCCWGYQLYICFTFFFSSQGALKLGSFRGVPNKLSSTKVGVCLRRRYWCFMGMPLIVPNVCDVSALSSALLLALLLLWLLLLLSLW